MKSITLLFAFALWAVTMVPHSYGVQISTTVGAGADIQLTEQEDGANGADESLNTRWNGTDRNEAVGLRFDLAGVDLSSYESASLNFVNFRDNAGRTIDVYAVPTGTAGGSGAFNTETWTEGGVTNWGDFPGCFVSDGSNSVTRSIDFSNLVVVASAAVSGSEGQVASASSPALFQFLTNLTSSTTATFLVTQGGGPDGGQFRFASKEATNLTTIAGSAGDFAPYLELSVFQTKAVVGTQRVSTADGLVGADTKIREHSDSADGDDDTIDVRWNGRTLADSGRNETIGLRFDLTGYDLSNVQSASLNLINARNNGEKLVDVYAVPPGTTSGSGSITTETWSEGNVNTWNDFPGLLMTDTNTTTLSVNTNALTLLVDEFLVVPATEGSLASISSPALTDHLRHLTNSTITLLITGADDLSNNQRRYLSKEAVETQGGLLTGSAGDFAPYLEFVIVPEIDGIAVDAGSSILVTWQAVDRELYGVERATDLVAPTNWVPVASNLLGSAENTYTDTAPTEAQVAYRVVYEGEAPATELFFEDFEGTVTNWVVTDLAGTTSWEFGTPNNYGGGSTGSSVPPSGAQEGSGAAGTDLDADYGPGTRTRLLSPVVDLTGATSAELSFGHYYDTEGLNADFGEVYVRDASGGEISGLTGPIGPRYQGLINDPNPAWETETLSLPPEAVDRSIRIEFYFESDIISTEYSGWYIDNVRVTN